MKANPSFFATICLFLLVNCAPLLAQNTNCWKGGTPGRESKWDCPKNWSANRVPDAFQNIIIPDVSTGAGVYPNIENNGMEVNALVLESGAKLEIRKNGSLVVHASMLQVGNSYIEKEGAMMLPATTYAKVGVLEATADNMKYSH